MDYSLCTQTVTLYRPETGLRQVIDGCHYEYRDILKQDVLGGRLDRKFLLVIPGNKQQVLPGDLVYDGIGPDEIDPGEFLPVKVPGLSRVEYVRPCCPEGVLCHTEAGRK